MWRTVIPRAAVRFVFANLVAGVAAVDPPVFKVPTAYGSGADAQLNEHTNSGITSGSSGDLNTRTSTDRNEIVALRFDLSDHSLSNLANVTLNIINFRDNSARQVALYGVKQGSVGGSGVYSTEDWDENTLTTFGDMPGLTVVSGDVTTQDLNPEQVIFLDQITFANLTKGSTETFSSPALTAFIRTSTESKLVTFLLAAAPGYTSSGQARFASKEASALQDGAPVGNPGDFAPYLSFENLGGASAPAVLITSPAPGTHFALEAPINIEVNTIDDESVAKVEFYYETESATALLGEDSTPPYTITFVPPTADSYTLRAAATDQGGLTGEHSVSIIVGATNPPTIGITSPVDGTNVFTGTPLLFAVSAADDVRIARVEFYAGTAEPLQLLGSLLAPPYNFQFTLTNAGNYILRAVAIDNLGLTNSASISMTAEQPAGILHTVSTAFGQGADAQANEHSDSVNAAGAELNTRTSSNGDRNEIVALRFDLSEFTLSELNEVSLNLINFRINSARQVALYGVAQGTRGGSDFYSTEDWSEASLLDFGDIPGAAITDGDFLTQSIDLSKVTPLGQITLANLVKGTTESFNDPALTEFVRSYAGSKLITFLLAAAPGYTSTGQARFASKEAFALEGDPAGEEAGKFAPSLSFRAGAVSELRITSVLRTGNQLTIQWTGGTGPFTVEVKSALGEGNWSSATAQVNGNTATVSLEESIGFFRIKGQ